MIEMIQSNLVQILATIFTTVASVIGMTIKSAYTKYVNTKTKKEIVNSTVQYVEQVCKSSGYCSEEKFLKAKNKALEWLTEKGIKISEIELEIMIESAVSQIRKEVK